MQPFSYPCECLYITSLCFSAARKRINEEYNKNKHVTNSEAICEMIELSKAVEAELKMSVVQAREVEAGKYELRILPETRKLDNIPFQNCKT
ncbi:hypothetical protein ANN_07847 [Periplaneta americana]|uniref:Uncharacterized protein n=1 Tax=Periplaneta americana TaxID=6978 RepID=A0ABQ8SZQ5_PERAM|nr:hypothetical protein ANN_07847 [Periplaneta americana]